jgi:hypothetical protein
MNFVKNIFPALALLMCTNLSAQSLRGLEGNPVIEKYRADHPARLKSAKSSVLLTLPFFEDFSKPAVIPDQSKWTDEYAYVNTSYGINPISVGVATLDAVDENGDVYAKNDFPVSSDKLTSQPFDLSGYSFPSDTVRLSFYFQCGGNGEVPELTDTLMLEFYHPLKKRWDMVWHVNIDSVTDFKQVILVVDSIYYKSGFQFRFRNYSSLSASHSKGGEGALSNVDCWNIDYIQMNTLPAQQHSTMNDIAMVDIPRKLIDYYEVIPWSHLDYAQSITRNYLYYTIRNLSDQEINVGRNYYTEDLSSGYKEFYDEFFEQFGPDTLVSRSDPFYAPFTQTGNAKEGKIEVVSYLVTPAGQYKQNDTSKIILDFKDSYAYDDGSPEYGFGISGPSTSGAMLAYRFRIYKTDTLRAIDMYFNKTRDNYNATLGFYLCVWNDNHGKPGTMIYKSANEFYPLWDNSALFKPWRYALDSNQDLVINDSIVYIGWQQTTEEFMNLGYDVNRDNMSKIFVNISGSWSTMSKSILPGSLMMRAVFGGKDVITGNDPLQPTSPDLTVYPNPASGIIFINSGDLHVRSISLYDISGRLVSLQNGSQSQIDVSAFAPGIYQALFTLEDGRRVNRKIVVCH